LFVEDDFMKEDNNTHLPGLLDLRDLLSAAWAVLAADLQADPKKQGKEKKPDENLVRFTFPG
jgi:hypothetical protein